MQDLTKSFPGLSEVTYLNTPAIGLVSRDVYEFKTAQAEDLMKRGSRYFFEMIDLNAQTRERIGSFFNGAPGYIALVPAFTFGFNAILDGLEPGLKVLLLENDYPSINWAVEARDFKVAHVKIDERLEERIHEAFKKNQPDVFIFSIVQYINGVKIDLSFVKELKAEFPNTLFIGDGTQYLGTEVFDFAASGLDVLGTSAYKWMGAGFGNGFFMFKSGVEEKINPKYLGFGSVMGRFKESGDSFIGKFEGGHLDPSNVGCIKTALEFQEKIGKEFIEKKVKELASEAKVALSELGLLEEAVVNRKIHSNIFNIKGDNALYEKLMENKIMCTPRGNGIRIGFHYYNSAKDLQRIIRVLKS